MSAAEPKPDPDETEGRRLYRARADKLAFSQMAIAARRVRLIDDTKEPGHADT